MPNLMTLDMGGTTAKASIIENGEMLQAPEYEVGGGISVGHRLLRGSGHILRVPAIDLAEVGAGGGSIATVDRSGSLRVGPRARAPFPARPATSSAGRMPRSPTPTCCSATLTPSICWLAISPSTRSWRERP